MSSFKIQRQVGKDPSWWHWLITIPLLAGYLAGKGPLIWVVMLLCLLVGSYYFARLKAIRPYPVQIRLGYLLLLGLGMAPWMQWIHWIQLLGTTAQVTVGYCPLARILNLLPWNRTEPLSRDLIVRSFFVEPCTGGIISWRNQPSPGGSCSLAGESLRSACSLTGQTVQQEEISHA